MLELKPLALGCAPLGGLFDPVDEETAIATIDAAWQAGIRAFDTAPLYGLGLSEQRLGAALTDDRRSHAFVSTKVGRILTERTGPPGPELAYWADPPQLEPVFDFSRDGVLRSLESSFERLRLDHVDLALLHDPDDHMGQAIADAYPALHDLRAQGAIGAIGAGMNQAPALVRFVRETDVDCVLIAGRYSLLDQSADEVLLPTCATEGVAVIVGGVFNSGILARPDCTGPYEYGPAPQPIVRRAQRIAAICERHDVPLPAAALAFPRRHPAVHGIVVGARAPSEVSAMLRNLDERIPQALWNELHANALIQ
jgi:D-threo-aldose 1-dehydrogenase